MRGETATDVLYKIGQIAYICMCMYNIYMYVYICMYTCI